MNIGILAVDSNFPNLALMKISAYHKVRGDQVEWYNPLCKYDKVNAARKSKVDDNTARMQSIKQLGV